MPLRTPEQYKAGLRDGRRVYLNGRRVEDITRDPVLSIIVEHGANVFAQQLDPAHQELMTYPSPETGDRVSRYFMVPTNGQELLQRGNVIESNTAYGNTTFNIIKAIGTDALLALTAVAHVMDRRRETHYSERVRQYFSHCRENDLSMAGAQTDVKGDRSLRPAQQADPDLYVRLAERRSDGIVVRGAKAHTTQGSVVDEVIVLPTRALREEDADYAVAFAVPANTPGLTFICRPTGSVEESPFDHPISRRNVETETLTIFDDVFVPWERVFMAGEWEFAGPLATTFANFHRHTAISYKPPFGDLVVGAAQLIAEANGVGDVGHIREKIAHMIAFTETIRACRLAAALQCQTIEPGIAYPNPVYANIGKYHFASNFHSVLGMLQDIAGGLAITAPTEADLKNPETGPYLEKYLKGSAAFSTVDRLKLFSLIRDATASDFGGYNYVVSLHGEGSLAAQQLTTYRDYDLERCKRYVKGILGIT